MKEESWDAKDYAENSNAQLGWAKGLIKEMAIKESDNLLDIGSGDGKITAELSKQCSNVIGIDSSEAMINFAKEQFTNTDYPKLSFEKMDATELSFKEKFDLVFSNATLHWVLDHASVLSGIRSALKANGHVFLSFGGEGNIDQILPFARQLQEDSRFESYFKQFSPCWYFPGKKDYQEYLSEAGLTALKVELVEKDMIHESPLKFEAWIRSTWHQYLSYLPSKVIKEQFAKELVRLFLAQYPVDSQGRTHTKLMRLEVIAKKEN